MTGTVEDQPRICGYCGVENPATRDHVVPRSLFPSPRPSDLITIPACNACNGSFAEDEERFRVVLSLQMGTDSEAANRVWQDAQRSVTHNDRLRRELVKGMRRTQLRTLSGLYLGEADVFSWSREVYDPIISKITRGLFFKHFNSPLPDQEISRRFVFKHADHLRDIEWSGCDSIANGAFRYWYAKASDHLTASIWVYLFHNTLLVGAAVSDFSEANQL